MAKIRKRTSNDQNKKSSNYTKKSKYLNFDVLPSKNNKSRKNNYSKKKQQYDDDILSESSDDDEQSNNNNRNENMVSPSSDSEAYDSDSDDVDETVDAKKIRLARDYLTKIEQSDDSGSSSSDSDSDASDDDDKDDNRHDAISHKLARDRLKRDGALQRHIADKIGTSLQSLSLSTTTPQINNSNSKKEALAKSWVDAGIVHYCRGHDLTVTCVALQQDGSTGYSGSKDNSIISWDIETQKKTRVLCPQWKRTDRTFPRNGGEVLSMAASDDGRYLAVGGRDMLVRIFDVRSSSAGSSGSGSGVVQEFKGHRGAVTGLAFRRGTLELYSGSEDRCIRQYNLDQMTYIQTLYGHQSPVTSLSCHLKPRPISTARDRTVRAWKLDEESHLIFRGGRRTTFADCCASINDRWFVTGHAEDGTINLWNAEKKKPMASVEWGHERDVVCCDAVDDLAVTGSDDGFLKLWKLKTGMGKEERSIHKLGEVPIHGFVNDVAVGPKGRFCVAAVGQEHRLGRWNRVPRAKNRFAIITLRKPTEENDADDDDDGEPTKGQSGKEDEMDETPAGEGIEDAQRDESSSSSSSSSDESD